MYNYCFPTVNQLPDQDIYTSKNAESKLSEFLGSLCYSVEDMSILFCPLAAKIAHAISSFTTDFSRMAYI